MKHTSQCHPKAVPNLSAANWAWVSKQRPARFLYAVRIHICNFYIYFNSYTILSEVRYTIYCDFYTAIREAAHSNKCGPFPKVVEHAWNNDNSGKLIAHSVNSFRNLGWKVICF